MTIFKIFPSYYFFLLLFLLVFLCPLYPIFSSFYTTPPILFFLLFYEFFIENFQFSILLFSNKTSVCAFNVYFCRDISQSQEFAFNFWLFNSYRQTVFNISGYRGYSFNAWYLTLTSFFFNFDSPLINAQYDRSLLWHHWTFHLSALNVTFFLVKSDRCFLVPME